MTRKLFTLVSLTIALSTLAVAPVQAKLQTPHWDPLSVGVTPYVIAGGLQVGDLAWIPVAVHDLICGG